MKISCKFGEPKWCSFPLRALTPKISLRGGGVANAKPNIHRIPPVDTIMHAQDAFYNPLTTGPSEGIMYSRHFCHITEERNHYIL